MGRDVDDSEEAVDEEELDEEVDGEEELDMRSLRLDI